MLGYGKDSHSYKFFNLFHYKVVETVDVRFDETNGSQREHLQRHRLKKKSSLHQVNMKTMLSLKTIPQMMTLISKSKISVLFILVLQMKFKLRR